MLCNCFQECSHEAFRGSKRGVPLATLEAGSGSREEAISESQNKQFLKKAKAGNDDKTPEGGSSKALLFSALKWWDGSVRGSTKSWTSQAYLEKRKPREDRQAMVKAGRLKLLKLVENLGVSYVKNSSEYVQKLETELRRLKFPYKALVEDDYDARRKDHISHFILRLAYCQSEDLRRWFIQQEMDLFRYRFHQLSDQLVENFLEYVNLAYNIIDATERTTIKDQLLNSTPGFNITKVENMVFYKVPFCDALDLVRIRRVYFHGGYAYVPHQDIVTIVLNNYRMNLSKALASNHELFSLH
uniref:Uncharacterized protein n=1 Tax=Sphaerodactylus townsendi TaxID=933632 RepID=A0ACB8GDE6_9SAUR